MTADQTALVTTAQTYLYPNYRQPPVVLVRGRGSELWDAAGKRYLDMLAGIAVCSLGHAHPRLVEALSTQASRLLQVSNYYYNEPNVRLAERLCQMTGMARAFFCNSGTEAIEASLKLGRRHFYQRGETERYRVIAFHNSFHGRTLGSLAVTGQPKYRDGFGPLSGVTHVPYGDLAAVEAAMAPDVAAILYEPIQGEGGVILPPSGFLPGLRALADRHGALLLADEVQTGVGRTGKFLASDHDGIKPDAVALAKGLGGGVPIGAMLCRAELVEALPPGSHGSTFGGNPLASAAALAVLEVLRSENLMTQAERLGDELVEKLKPLVTKFPAQVECVRGRGLLIALVMREKVDMRAFLSDLREAGLVLSVAGERALRFSPALTVTAEQLGEAAAIVEKVLGRISAR
jgi:acetylornithine/N-succinyldiaminopimelate aminotransferase